MHKKEIAKKIKAHRKKILKKVMPIGDIVETVKEANRMRAFAARVGLMKISMTPGPGVPNALNKDRINMVISKIQEKFAASLVHDTTRKETIEFKVPPLLR